MNKITLALMLSLLIGAAPLPAAHAAGAPQAQANAAGKAKAGKAKVKRKAAPVAKAGSKAQPRQKLVRRVQTVRGKRVVSYQPVRRAVPVMAASMGELAGLGKTVDPLSLRSNVAYVIDQHSAEVLFEKNAGVALPIASITKLMTGMIVVQAGQDLDEVLRIDAEDVDRQKFSSSRLPVGARLTRRELLHITLMSSENRAAAALGRHYPGGTAAFVTAMNAKARELGMGDTRYADASGLSRNNVSSARDLARLVTVAYHQPLLREFSTSPRSTVLANGRSLEYSNTNYLVAEPDWQIGLQKTGYISEAGRCLVMQAVIHGRDVVMVFLDSKGKMSRTADAGRIRRWLESLPEHLGAEAGAPAPIMARVPATQAGVLGR